MRARDARAEQLTDPIQMVELRDGRLLLMDTRDMSRRRIIEFDPEGNPVRSFSTMGGDGSRPRLNSPCMRSVDSAGRWLGRGRRFSFAARRVIVSDANFVIRSAPETNRTDTVATLVNPRPERNADGSYLITSFEDVDAARRGRLALAEAPSVAIATPFVPSEPTLNVRLPRFVTRTDA